MAKNEEKREEFDFFPGSDPLDEAEFETTDEVEDRGDDTEIVSEAADTEEVVEEEVSDEVSDADEVVEEAEEVVEEEEVVGKAVEEEASSTDDSVKDDVESTPAQDRISELVKERTHYKAIAERLQAEQDARLSSQEGNRFDYDAKEREYMEAVVDGELDKAMSLRNEIRAAERAEYQATLENTSRSTMSATQNKLQFDNTVIELESKYDALNPKSDSYNDALAEEAVDMKEAIYAQHNGAMSHAEALRKAVSYVANMYGLTDKTLTKETVAEEAAPVTTKKPVNVKEKVAASKKQPAQMPEGNSDSAVNASNVDELSEEEFDALPESTKARMRGDLVA